MNHREEDDPFEEDIVFDQAGLLSTSHKSAIRRISSGKCATFSKTLALCGAFLGLGLTCAIPGPLSPVPPNELSQDISLMSPEIMFKCFGFMVGSMFGAKLLDRFNRLFLVFLALLMTALLVIIIPWCRVAWLLRSDMFFIGGTIGFLSTGGNVLCLDLWGRNSGPFMQALHFSLSLGVFLAPLLSQPLMIPSNNGSVVTSTTPGAFPLNRLPRDVNAVLSKLEGKDGHILGLANSSDHMFQSSAPVGLNTSSNASLALGGSTTSFPFKLNSTDAQTPASPVSTPTSTSFKPSASSKIVLPASLVHAPPSNLTHVDLENSSTTHRVPKPKPELTNSDKLKDKNWENDKFRKPPPEDLVPVSTTMKTTTLASQAVVSANSSGLVTTTSPRNMNLTQLGNATVPKNLPSAANSSTFSSVAPSLLDLSRMNKTAAATSSTVQTSPTAASLNSTRLSSAALSSTVPSSTVPTSSHSSKGVSPTAVSSVESETNPGKSTTAKGQGLESLSLLEKPKSSTKLPFAVNFTDSLDDLEQQTRLLPLQEKPVSEEKSQDDSRIIANGTTSGFKDHESQHIVHVTSQTQKSQKKVQNKQVLPPQLLQGQQQHVEVTTKLPGKTVSAVLSNASVPEISSKIEGPLIVSSAASTIVASTRRTHHSKPASTVVNDTEVTHTVIGAFANRLEKYGLSKMELIYLVVGMVLLATSLLFLGFLCFNPRDPKSKTDEEEMNGHVSRGRNASASGGRQMAPPPLPRWLRNSLMALMLLILMINSGIQAMYGQLLLVFSTQSPLQLSQSTGTALTATFWGALTSSRFACILLASALSPSAMLVLSVALCSCATWLLSALASSSEVALWIGSVMVGVGTASVFPSGLLWMQRYLVVTHRVAAMLVMGPAMGEMLFPMLVYKMMVGVGPGSLVHLPALLSLFLIALWAAVWRLARLPRWQGDGGGPGSASGYQLANQNDEDDLLDLTMSPVINGSLMPRGAAAAGRSFHRLSS